MDPKSETNSNGRNPNLLNPFSADAGRGWRFGFRTFEPSYLFRFSKFGFRVLPTCCLLAAIPVLLAGCGIGSERKHALELEVENLTRQKAEVAEQLEQCRAENAQLAGQIEALSPLGPDRPLDPYKLTGVRIARYSNFYDKNDDGRREKLIVYLQPIDTAGDVVKAAGAVQVQLWNLNNPDGEALLGQWQIDPDDLHGQWISAMISASYRLMFDTPASLDVLAEPLTLKVTFTDYLTGEIFRNQAAIDPRL